MGLKTRIIAFVIVAFSVMNLLLCLYITHQVKALELESLRAQIDKSTYLMKNINTLPLYNVDMEALKNSDKARLTHINLNDDTIEGIRVKGKKAFSVQYHPEAAPGPHDAQYLFDQFVDLINQAKNN